MALEHPASRQVVIFRSERKSGAYLYVPALSMSATMQEQCAGVPEALLAQLGELAEVMRLDLDAHRKLANADAKRVLQQLDEAGYYLQMPPLPGSRDSREREAGEGEAGKSEAGR